MYESSPGQVGGNLHPPPSTSISSRNSRLPYLLRRYLNQYLESHLSKYFTTGPNGSILQVFTTVRYVCFFITPTSVLQYPTVPPSTFHLPRSYYCTFVFATEVPLPMYLLLLLSVDLVEKDHGCGDRCEVELHVALHYYYVGPPMRRTLLLRTRLMISEIESYQVRYLPT